MGCGGSLAVTGETTFDVADHAGKGDAAIAAHIKAGGPFAAVRLRERTTWKALTAVHASSGRAVVELSLDGATQLTENTVFMTTLLSDGGLSSLQRFSFHGAVPLATTLAEVAAMRRKGETGVPGPPSSNAWGGAAGDLSSDSADLLPTIPPNGRRASLSEPNGCSVNMASLVKFFAATPNLTDVDLGGPYLAVAACRRTALWSAHEQKLVAGGATDLPAPPSWEERDAPGSNWDPNAVVGTIAVTAKSHLKTLRLAGAGVTNLSVVAEHCESLEELELRGSPGISDRSVKLIVEGCPRLMALDISRVMPSADADPTWHAAVTAYCNVHSCPLSRSLSVASLRHIAPHLCPPKRLRALDITGICYEGTSFRDGAKHALELARALPDSLRQLRLGMNGPLVGDDFVRVVAKQCPHLEKFALDMSVQAHGKEMCVADAAIATLLRRCAGTLTHLELRHVGSPSQLRRVAGLGQTFSALNNLRALKTLCFESPAVTKNLSVAPVAIQDVGDDEFGAPSSSEMGGVPSRPREWAVALLRAWAAAGEPWTTLEGLDPAVADAVTALAPTPLTVVANPTVSRRPPADDNANL